VSLISYQLKSTRINLLHEKYSSHRALGCLFTSFASQFHQLFFSYGTVVGVGVGMTRDCSTLMVAQYFKRKREFVEIFIVSGSGLGIVVMSTFIKSAIEAVGWRCDWQLFDPLQIINSVVSCTDWVFNASRFVSSALLFSALVTARLRFIIRRDGRFCT
jgi:hypothetical protein